jgi:hypothetical protein
MTPIELFMYNTMSGKPPKNTKIKYGECTEFQMHKSQQMAFSGIMHRVFDFTEKKTYQVYRKNKRCTAKIAACCSS